MSHETIYQALYVRPEGELARQVKEALRTGRTRRKPQGRQSAAEAEGHGQHRRTARRGRGPGRARSLGRRPDHRRPLPVRDRHPGGTRPPGSCCCSTCRDDHTAATVADAMSTAIGRLPEQLRRSLTWDQGSEMALHTKITERDRSADLLLRPPQPLAARHATRTPTGCCASTSPKAPTCRSTAPACSTRSPPSSTPAPGNVSASKPPPKPSNGYYPSQPNLLHRQPESKRRVAL